LTIVAAPGQDTPRGGHVAAYANVEHVEDCGQRLVRTPLGVDIWRLTVDDRGCAWSEHPSGWTCGGLRWRSREPAEEHVVGAMAVQEGGRGEGW